MTANSAPPVIRSAWVSTDIAESFRIFTDEIGAWWPLPTHGLFGDRSATVRFEAGQLIEQAVDGTQTVWAQVQVWEPPARFSLRWHPGGEAAEGSDVEVSFESSDGGTRVVVEHRGWESFGEQARERRRNYVGPNAWGYVLDHFADGAEPKPKGADLAALRSAYEAFFAEADKGNFGAAEDGEWNAEQVVAHVALNDASMLSVCQAIVHQLPARFENQTCQQLDVLQRYIEGAGGMSGLIERGRSMSQLVLAALSRLSPEQGQTAVDCHLTHDGAIMVDHPLPWFAVAGETQAERHLPAHIEQLQNLRLRD